MTHLMWGTTQFLQTSSCSFDSTNSFEPQIYRSFIRGFPKLDDLCQGGRLKEALEIMEHRGIHVSRNNAYCLLQECIRTKDLECGRRLQKLMVQSGVDSIAVLGDFLIRLFVSNGCLLEANKAFTKILQPSFYSWDAIISAHMKLGQAEHVLLLYERMQIFGLQANNHIFLSVFKSCALIGDCGGGRLVHEEIMGSEYQFDIFIGSTLVDMYAKCQKLEEAQTTFDKLQDRDVVSWNAMIAAYAQHEECLPALKCFETMQQFGVKPNEATFTSILKTCGSIGAIDHGKMIHVEAIAIGLQFDLCVGSTLVDMYAKCGRLEEACANFNKLPTRDVVSWNSMIAGYAQHGAGLLALDCLEIMHNEGIKPSKVTYLSILKACGGVGAIEHGRQIHEQILVKGLQIDIVLGNTVIDMYTKCGHLEEAYTVFYKMQTRDVVSWNAMIAGFAQNGEGVLALEYFEDMEDVEIKPTVVTFSSAVKACSIIGRLEVGRCIHEKAIVNNFQFNCFIGSGLVDMYCKCKSLDEACEVFDRLPDRNVVVWNAMIVGYVQHGEGVLAIQCFSMMKELHVNPNKTTFSSILKACGIVGAIEQGRHIHEQIIEKGLELETFIGGALVDMYAKCGTLEEAGKIFSKLPNRDVVSWNSMIAGYSQHGDPLKTVQIFEDMRRDGVEPDDVTFTAILTLCCRVDLVDEGRLYFKSLTEEHNITPNIFHYNCLVDLLGRAGDFEESEQLLKSSSQASSCGWMALLNACKMHNNEELGKLCFREVVYLDSWPTAENVPFSVILENPDFIEVNVKCLEDLNIL